MNWKLSAIGNECQLDIGIDQSWWYFEPTCKRRKNQSKQERSAEFEGFWQQKVVRFEILAKTKAERAEIMAQLTMGRSYRHGMSRKKMKFAHCVQ